MDYLALFFILNIKYSHSNIINITSILNNKSEILPPTNLKQHFLNVANYFYFRKNWKTSNLGSIMFKNENYDSFAIQNRTFEVLVWKHWEWLKNRHVYNFGPKNDDQDILDGCSVNNCIFTGNDSTLHRADAVLIHIMKGLIPTVKKRNQEQIWVYLNDESPMNVFHSAKKRPKLKLWNNIFNWSMTYRSDADVPVPYGRTVPLHRPMTYNITYQSIAKLVPNLQYKRSDVLVAILISHCTVEFRKKILNELEKYLKIDVYGKCSKDLKKRLSCPGHFRADCQMMSQYYFYLVMENSICRQYISEKVFHHAYAKGAIPIIVGPSSHDSKMLLPPNSYIHYQDYVSPKELAAKINRISHNLTEYLSYHLWRNNFEVLNEHGYFRSKSYHLCRLCEALNYNLDEENIYTFDDLRLFLDPKILCSDKLYVDRKIMG